MKINVPKRLKKTLIGVAVFFVLYTVIGFLVLPPIARSLIEKDMGAALHRKTTLRKVLINPYTFKVVLKGLTVREKDGAKTFVSFEELSINIQSISLFRKGVDIKEVVLQKPYLHIVRKKEDFYNISDLISGKGPQKKQPFQFTVGDVRISGGTIDFEDLPKGKSHKITGIILAVPFVSDRPHYVATFVRPELSGKIDGAPFHFTGKTVPFSKSHQTFLDINIANFNIPYFFSYLPLKPGIALKTGLVNANLRLSYTQYEKKPPSLSLKGTLEFSNVDLLDADGRTMVKVPQAAIDIGDAEFFSRKVHIADIRIQSPFLGIKRDSSGALNLLSLVPPAAEGKQAPVPAGKKENPLSLDIGKFSLTGGKIEFSDALRESVKPVKLTADNISVNVQNISTEKNREAGVTLSGNIGKGRFDIAGTASLNPLMSKLRIDVKKLALPPFQPYMAGRIRMGITAGEASTSGNISLKSGGEKKYDISFRGDVEISDFSSVDSAKDQRLLKWASLRIEGIDTGGDFRKISIKGFSLSRFYARVIIQPDGTLNIMHLMKKAPPPSPGAAKGGEAAKSVKRQPGGKEIVIGTSTLEGGTIDFTDLHIKPRYSAKLTDITGRVSELSSISPSPADVDLFGKWNSYAPLEITGKVNPFGEDLFADLKLDFKNMDLTPLTPFSNKFIGYSIEKGKLTLKLKYRIVKKMLTAENFVSLDQLTLGRKVESPDAVRLPIKFAISLLKDREGRIDLNVPVSGRTDDPKFSLGSVILKAIGHFITRIITSPFRLIASLFGGGGPEKLSYLEFNYGSSSLSPENVGKLGMMMKALYERPNLELDIAGYVSPQKDRDSLRQITFQMKLKKQALLDMEAKGKKPVPLDQVEIKPEDHDRILWEVYRKEKFPRPTNFLGFVKKLPPPEMEKLILTHIIITDDDLRRLAHDRAKAARSYILNAKVNPDRVFLLEPQSLTPEKKDDLKESRVEFTLK